MDITTMAMNLYSQGVDPKLDLSNPDEIIQVAGECTDIPLHPRHPWFGELVYTAFSGSHQDAIRKCLQQQKEGDPWQVAYLPIDPKDLGRDYQAIIRVNSQSGKGGVAFVLERDFGLSLPRWLQVELAQVVQKASEAQGGEMAPASIHALFKETFIADAEPVSLTGYQLDRSAGHDAINAHIVERGMKQTLHGEGEGALSAFVDALMKHGRSRIAVVDYSEHAVTEGTNAEAVAYVQLNIDGRRASGVAFDHDTVSASMKAVLSAWNRTQIAAAREQKVA
jgi:2-isopropylmalate synthase